MSVRILLTGAGGVLGGYLLPRLRERADNVVAWTGRAAVDLTDADTVTTAFRAACPDVVVHAAALARVADCHGDPDRARRVNADATARLALLCCDVGGRLVFVSTDLVFDGDAAPYREGDPVNPLSVYGRSKAEGEAAVRKYPEHAIARLSLLYGPARSGGRSFFDGLVAALGEGRPVTLFGDEWRTPLALTTAADALAELALSTHAGLFHIGGPERLSRLEMGRRLAKRLGLSDAPLRAAGRGHNSFEEPRPRDTSLDSSRWRTAFPHVAWPGYEASLAAMLGLS